MPVLEATRLSVFASQGRTVPPPFITRSRESRTTLMEPNSWRTGADSRRIARVLSVTESRSFPSSGKSPSRSRLWGCKSRISVNGT